jgi:hypothetical protein
MNDRLTKFYGIFPDYLFNQADVDHHDLDQFHFRSNGIFLNEPSFLAQATAIGILIEILEFGRTRYLAIIGIGLALSYGGTGLILLAVFLPMVALRHGRAGLSVLLFVIFALGLIGTGMIDQSFFFSRVGELQAIGSSGFSRFIAPFWLVAQQFQTESWQELLLGHGPGTIKFIVAKDWYTGDFAVTWLRLFDEYGIIGLFILSFFFASCFRRSRCPGLVIAAIMFAWLFLQGFFIIMIPLCTLSRFELRRIHRDRADQHQSSPAGC